MSILGQRMKKSWNGKSLSNVIDQHGQAKGCYVLKIERKRK